MSHNASSDGPVVRRLFGYAEPAANVTGFTPTASDDDVAFQEAFIQWVWFSQPSM